MHQFGKRHPFLLVGIGTCLGLIVGVAMFIGAFAATSSPADPLNELLLHATASHGSDEFAIATGQVSDDAEGLFVLDFETGELTCHVIYPRFGIFGARYAANVVADLGIERGKTPKYIMVTGTITPSGGTTGQGRPAGCVVYVADANTGNIACYSLVWNRQFATSGRVQGGPLILVAKGKARDIDLEK